MRIRRRTLIVALVGATVGWLLALPGLARTYTYVVRPGDSAWKIARRVGVPTEQLLAANGLSERSVLRPGQRLQVPVEGERQRRAPEGAASGLTYVVKRGDTLSEVAHRYGVSPRLLARANHLSNPHHLRVGQKLYLPPRPGGQGGERPSEQASELPGRSLVETALQYRGVPYRWAGMSTRGMDCSGLVARVLLAHGIRAPHSSRELYRLGRPVSREELQPGDLVFFATRGRGISHVGIYLGGGKFIHASSSAGRVQVDRLDRGHYQRRFVGARRVK